MKGLPAVLHALTRASLNCESETRNAKRLKCGKAVRNGPKFWDRFAGPNAGGHTKERNILRNKKFSFSPQRSKLTEIAAIFHCLPLWWGIKGGRGAIKFDFFATTPVCFNAHFTIIKLMKDIEQHVMVIFLNNKILGNGPGIIHYIK
jgi:hypothetical protein